MMFLRNGRVLILSALLAMSSLQALCENDSFSRHSLSDMLECVKSRFGIKLKIDVDTAGLELNHAYSRLRPYSVEESMRNILAPFDFHAVKVSEDYYRVRRYEHYRRPESDGAKMLSWLLSRYPSKESWESRRDSLRCDMMRISGVGDALDERVGADPVMSGFRQFDGYSVENFYLETLPGLYVCGSIYYPATSGKHPLIICPNGHFKDGRYCADQQKRLATLARMGAVCVDYDLYGWGESALQVGAEGHKSPEALTVQLVNGISILDFMLGMYNIDVERVGVNGGSGGGSQSVLLAFIDQRFTAACPVVSLSSHFDGGCECESGKPIMLSGGGSCMAEFAASFAPKPMCVVSDGGDWTSTVPEIEYPYLKQVYAMYGRDDAVSNVHFPDEGHDFGPSKRNAVYDFFIDTFGLDRSMLDESKAKIEAPESLKSFGRNGENMPDNAIKYNSERKL